MSPPEKEGSTIDDRVDLLERRATVVRSRLLRAIDALDARRHQVAKMSQQARSIARTAALSFLGIAAMCGVGVFAVGLALKHRHRRSLSYRVSHAVQGLNQPRQPPLGRRIFERVTLALITVAATELAKRATKNVLDGRRPLAGRRVALRETV